ncbi:MAG: hypothetical protein KTR26_13590 [Flammeovirgaceae bacterium]|nr:hypothetical protein [Flammeovirgaceae bacterium]
MKFQWYFRSVLFFVVISSFQNGICQPLEKIHFKSQFDFTISSDYYLKNKSRLFSEIYFNNLFSDQYNNGESNITPIGSGQFLLGFEKKFKGKWSGGLSQKFIQESQLKTYATRLFLRHSGSFLNLIFDKRLNYEVEYYSNATKPLGKASLFVSLAKRIEINKWAIYPAVSFQVFKASKQKDDPSEKRRFSNSILRADFLLNPSANFLFGIFIQKETNYYFGLEQFDQNGMTLKPFRKLNIIQPTLGLTFKYQFHPNNIPKGFFNFLN